MKTEDSFAFSFEIPSSTPPSQRCVYGMIMHSGSSSSLFSFFPRPSFPLFPSPLCHLHLFPLARQSGLTLHRHPEQFKLTSNSVHPPSRPTEWASGSLQTPHCQAKGRSQWTSQLSTTLMILAYVPCPLYRFPSFSVDLLFPPSNVLPPSRPSPPSSPLPT